MAEKTKGQSPKNEVRYEIVRAFGAKLPAAVEGGRERTHYFTNNRESRRLLVELPAEKLTELRDNGNIREVVEADGAAPAQDPAHTGASD